MAIRSVGVVGLGLMGSGIAEISARAGFETAVREVDDALLKKGLARVETSLGRAVEKGKLGDADRKAALARLRGTTNVADLRSCDLVVEAIVEDLEAKRALLRALDEACPPATVFASNTSSLSITELAAATRRPDRVVGLHFFNPVPVMRLVEIVRTIQTSDAAYAVAREFAEKTGKTPIDAKDTGGFVVNRLLVPYLLGAIRALESGVASRDDIDNGMKLGCGHPMGPLELLDFVGLDTTYSISQILFDEFKEPTYAAPPLLKRMVLAGRLGRKAGRGFYDWSAGEKR